MTQDEATAKVLLQYGFLQNMDETRPYNIVKFAVNQLVSIKVITLLLENGADPNIRDWRDGGTALHSLFWYDYIDLLIRYGVKINAIDKHGETPLDMMIFFKKEDEIRALAKYKPKMNKPSPEAIVYVREVCPELLQQMARRMWLKLFCVVKLLSLHQRAVITANHPKRLEAQGYFELPIE